MAARKKPANLVLIEDLKQADQALAEIADIGRTLARQEARVNQIIDRAKADAAAICAPLLKRLAALEGGLNAYALHKKDELFKDRRSVELMFGEFGFRKSTEIKPEKKHTWADVLAHLEALGAPAQQFIRTKKEVNKEALGELKDDEERLAELLVRAVQKDTFWYEVKQEEMGNDVA